MVNFVGYVIVMSINWLINMVNLILCKVVEDVVKKVCFNVVDGVNN